MAVGNQTSVDTVNNILSNLAVQLRTICDVIRIQQTFLTELGQSGLETVGFDSEDAASVLSFMGYLNTVAGVYYGQVQQGGSGGTGASLFDFDNALCALWGGA